jgi:acetoin utilization deacetylase AcuC-like enzyme
MGFCPVNLVACAVAQARHAGADRALIVDWDVHHGNGTQAIVAQEVATRFVSMHQHPWYPGTGMTDDREVGNCFNVPLPPALPRERYVAELWSAVQRASDDWVPDVVVVSAGYDGMAGDPLGGFTLEPDDYVTWVRRLRERWPDTPLVAVMEGGYAPERLADGVLATVAAMQGDSSWTRRDPR